MTSGQGQVSTPADIRREIAQQWTGTGSVVDELADDRRSEAAREQNRA
ncbi:hypothetical protein [Saccharopolyspora sp. CA-218241]